MTRGGQCSSSTLAPSFPASSPKVAGAFRSCSSHTRAPSHHSLARSLELGLLVFASSFFHFFSTCTLKRLWLSHSLCASSPIFFFTTTTLHPLASTTEPSTPISSFNNTKVSHTDHRERVRGIHRRAWRHSTALSSAPLETPPKHERHPTSHARDCLPLYPHAVLRRPHPEPPD